MRPKLLKSFVVVVIFWMLATTLYWSFQMPEVQEAALARLGSLLGLFFGWAPFGKPPEGEASWLRTLEVQRQVLLYWTFPVLLLCAVSAATGLGVVWSWAVRHRDERKAREAGSGNYRGVTLTLGALPMPTRMPRDEIDLDADNNEALSRLTELEKRALCEILGTISAAPDAYSGDGISVPLIEHTLNLVSKALNNKRNPGLSAIMTAAHELGKLTAYTKRSDGEWALVKNYDREAARILGVMDGWFKLPHTDKLAVMMAVKFHGNPRLIPDLEGNPQVYRLARDLLSATDEVVVEAVTEEKQKTLEKTELPDVIWDSFLRTLPSLSFQSRGLPKGVAAVAWKVGNRVYMLEIKLRETVMAKMPQDVRGALTPTGKDQRQRLQPFTMELLKSLDKRGWLVRQVGDMRVDLKDALWNIKAGKLDFKGVIIIDVPKDNMQQLPSDDSMYEVSVIGPLFTGAGGGSGGMNISKNDLLGSVLRPASAPASAPTAAPATAPKETAAAEAPPIPPDLV